jgi:hypothetical protein
METSYVQALSVVHNSHRSSGDTMTSAKALFVVGGIVVLGMLGAEKLRAQPSPVDCDRYAQE